MARKIRFPLKMKNGAEVRTLDELKENFDLESVLGYYVSGQLVTWLRNYYYDDIADKVEAFDKDSDDISKQLCETLGVEYVENDLTVDEVKAKIDRENLLKQLSEEQIRCLATNQEELEKLWYGNTQTIYLAFGEFELIIPGYGYSSEYVLIKETNPQVVKFGYVDKYNLKWSLKYANAGIAAAQYEVGCYYYDETCGWEDFPKNNEKMEILYEAIKWLEKAASQDYIESFRSLELAYDKLAYMYEMGYVVKKNFIKANECYRKAAEIVRKSAESGDVEAQCNLAHRYYNGSGVEKDYSQTVEWYVKAAEQGYASAQYNLGYMYYKGQGVATDYTKAVEWYRKAAEQGHAHAQNCLGNMFFKGEGVEQNYIEAIEWYLKAAEQGMRYAMGQLGLIYENGYGVTPDKSKANEWYSKSKEIYNSSDMATLLKAAEEEAKKENDL